MIFFVRNPCQPFSLLRQYIVVGRICFVSHLVRYCIIPHSWGVIVVQIILSISICVEAIEGILKLFCIELAQRRLPPRSGPQSIKSLLCSNILLYCAFLLFITGGSPHLVSEHFLGLVGWHFRKKKISVMLPGSMHLTAVFLLAASLFIWIRD